MSQRFFLNMMNRFSTIGFGKILSLGYFALLLLTGLLSGKTKRI